MNLLVYKTSGFLLVHSDYVTYRELKGWPSDQGLMQSHGCSKIPLVVQPSSSLQLSGKRQLKDFMAFQLLLGFYKCLWSGKCKPGLESGLVFWHCTNHDRCHASGKSQCFLSASVSCGCIRVVSLEKLFFFYFNAVFLYCFDSVSAHISEHPNQQPSHKIQITMGSTEARVDYMGSSILMGIFSNADLKLQDEWKINLYNVLDSSISDKR